MPALRRPHVHRKGGSARSSTSRPGWPRTAEWTRASPAPPTGPDRATPGGPARAGAAAVRARSRRSRTRPRARRRAGAGRGGPRDARRRPGEDRRGARRSRARRRGGEAEAARRRRRRQPAADPRPLSGRRSRSGFARRSRRSAPTWNPTRATSSCSESRTGWCGLRAEGQLRRLPGLGLDARAGDQGGAREGGAGPGRPRGRGGGRVAAPPEPIRHRAAGDPVERQRQRRRRARAQRAAGRSAAGCRSAPRRRRRRGRWTQVGGVEIAVANVGGSLLAFRDRCAACGEPIADGRLKGGVLDCPSCERRFYLPRAGRSMDEERLLLEPVPLLESGGEVTVAVAAMSERRRRRAVAATLRRLTSPRRPERRRETSAATSAAPSSRSDHRHLLHLEERRILCACEPCVAMRSGDGPYRPTGSRLLWLEGFELPEELWARLRIPIGLAFFMRSSSVGRVVGLYPSPAGRDRMRARARGLGGPLRRQPGCSTALDEDVEGLIVNRIRRAAPVRDRPDRRVLPPGRRGQGELGGDLRRRRGRAVVPAFLEELRAAGGGGVSAGRSGNGWAPADERRRGRRRRAAAPEHPAPSFAVRGARVPRHSRRRRPSSSTSRSTTPPSAQVFTIALAVQIAIEPAQRRYDEETRERLTELLGEPGPDRLADADACPGRRSTCSSSRFTERPRSRCRSPATTTSRSPPPTTSARSPTARCRWSSTSTAASTTRATDGRLQIVQISWEESSDYRMPIEVWQEMIDAHYPYRGWIPAGERDDRAAAPLQAGAGPAVLRRRRWRGCWAKR